MDNSQDHLAKLMERVHWSLDGISPETMSLLTAQNEALKIALEKLNKIANPVVMFEGELMAVDRSSLAHEAIRKINQLLEGAVK